MNFPWIALIFPAPGTGSLLDFEIFAVTESKDCAGTNTPHGPLSFRLAEDGERVVYQLDKETGVIGIGDMPRLIAADLAIACHNSFQTAKAWAKAKCDAENDDRVNEAIGHLLPEDADKLVRDAPTSKLIH